MKRSRNRSSRNRPPLPALPPDKPARRAPAPAFSSRHKWAYRLTASLLVPFLLLGALEGVLRVAGYGYATSFFIRKRINDEDVLVENDKFGLRFFPPSLARGPAPVVMRVNKPADTYRIFLMGESAALGDPKPAYGMGRYLQALLNERFPGTRFEVVCVAMTAINSHAVVPLARECAQRRGDLWIVYLGNNEMAGPFGANTVFGAQAPCLGVVRATLTLRATRIGQLLAALGQHLHRDKAGPTSWGGLKMFLTSQLPPQDPRKQTVYVNFQKNLTDIVHVGLRSGAQVVLSTVPSNLKDCAPFASARVEGQSESDQARWDALYLRGVSAQSSNRIQEALTAYEGASRLDSRFAELRFREAQCWLALTNYGAARRNFELARDYDALPFRADSKLNAIIAEIARQNAGKGVQLLDAMEVLAQQTPERIPGGEAFYEHVHLTFDANYRLARAFAERVEPVLPKAARDQRTPAWASQRLCEDRLGLTDWNRYGVYEDVLRRLAEAPFTNQVNQATRLRVLATTMTELKERLHPRAYMDARVVYEEALKRVPGDHRLHENFAEFLEANGELGEATAQWQRVCDLLPHHHAAYYHVGRLFARQSAWAEAETWLRRTLALRPDLLDAYLELGSVMAVQGNLEPALVLYGEARRRWPDEARFCVRIADVLAKQNKRAEAMASLREAVQLRPSYWEPRYLLGVELAMADQCPEAEAEFKAAVRLKPDHALSRLNLGVALIRQGKALEAKHQFAETLRLDPQNEKARRYLETVEAMLQKLESAPAPAKE